MKKSKLMVVRSSDLTRLELVDAVGRLRAALLVDKPSLSPGRQTTVQHVLDSTLIQNDEPENLPEVGLTFDHNTKVLTVSIVESDDGLDLEFEDSSLDDYHHLERVFNALTAGGKLTCSG